MQIGICEKENLSLSITNQNDCMVKLSETFFFSDILKIDTVRAFHLADGFIVEVDIVLPRDMPLNQGTLPITNDDVIMSS
jgi:hypothetical protein